MKTLLLLVSFGLLAQSTQPVKLDTDIVVGPVTAHVSRIDLSPLGPVFSAGQPLRYNISLKTLNPDTTKMTVGIVTQNSSTGSIHTITNDYLVAGQNAVAMFACSDDVLLSFSVAEISTPLTFDGGSQEVKK